MQNFEASFSIIPIPLGLGSALIDLFKNALNGFFEVEDTLNETVSPWRTDNLSAYPNKGISFIEKDHKLSREDM